MAAALLDEPMAAKKAARKTPTKDPESKPQRKPMVVQIRGSEEYKAWVEGMAEAEGFTVAMLFDRAVRAWAKEHGHPESPKR